METKEIKQKINDYFNIKIDKLIIEHKKYNTNYNFYRNSGFLLERYKNELLELFTKEKTPETNDEIAIKNILKRCLKDWFVKNIAPELEKNTKKLTKGGITAKESTEAFQKYVCNVEFYPDDKQKERKMEIVNKIMENYINTNELKNVNLCKLNKEIVSKLENIKITEDKKTKIQTLLKSGKNIPKNLIKEYNKKTRQKERFKQLEKIINKAVSTQSKVKDGIINEYLNLAKKLNCFKKTDIIKGISLNETLKALEILTKKQSKSKDYKDLKEAMIISLMRIKKYQNTG